MDPFFVIAFGLLAFEAVYNSWEFSWVYRLRKDKAKFIEAHSRFGEGSELVAFVMAGILLFLSNFNMILISIVIVLGLYHVMGTISDKNKISEILDNQGQKMTVLVMTMCAIEVVLSLYIASAIMF